MVEFGDLLVLSSNFGEDVDSFAERARAELSQCFQQFVTSILPPSSCGARAYRSRVCLIPSITARLTVA